MRVLARGLMVLALLAPVSGCEKLPKAPTLPNTPPTASFFFTPIAPIFAGQTPVAFSGVGSRDSDGTIATYIWNFGDGSAEQTTTTPVVQHVFPDTGATCLNVTYGVSLVVLDDRGGRGVASLGVTVTELPAPSSVECLPPPR